MPHDESIHYPVHELITERWSPYGFSDRPVSDSDLGSLFEAARWAASSFNDQPWSYLVATSADSREFERLLSCLVEGNQAWARKAPVLALAVSRLEFARNQRRNRHALHDLGLATANLCLEATARGLSVHQMAGILPDRARRLYEIPEDSEAVTGIAIGYAADPDDLSPELRSRDQSRRSRKPLSDMVFSGRWGVAARLIRESG